MKQIILGILKNIVERYVQKIGKETGISI